MFSAVYRGASFPTTSITSFGFRSSPLRRLPFFLYHPTYHPLYHPCCQRSFVFVPAQECIKNALNASKQKEAQEQELYRLTQVAIAKDVEKKIMNGLEKIQRTGYEKKSTIEWLELPKSTPEFEKLIAYLKNAGYEVECNCDPTGCEISLKGDCEMPLKGHYSIYIEFFNKYSRLKDLERSK